MPNTTVVVQPLAQLLRATHQPQANPFKQELSTDEFNWKTKRIDTTKVFKLHAIGVLATAIWLLIIRTKQNGVR